ncbi:MAG: NACHT domain-containing protein [Anaerolineales bacterium]|nr:NACHT domain-containing protein [Anaerolineales bacterium]
MAATVYLTPLGKALQAELKTFATDGEAFARGRLGRREALRRLLGEHYEDAARRNYTPDQMASIGLERLVLRLWTEAAPTGEDGELMAQGLMLVWFQYLHPVNYQQNNSFPDLGRVLRFCGALDNRLAFVLTARKTLNLSEQQTGALRQITERRLFSGVNESTRDPNTIRSFRNYFYRALEFLAGRPEVAEPSQPREAAAESKPAAPADLRPLAQFIQTVCAQAPAACGLQLPITETISRLVSLRVVRGAPALPEAEPSPAAQAPWAALVLAGPPGSGRTTWLQQLAFNWAKAWQADAPLAVYVRAPEFLPFARTRRSISAFAACALYPDLSASRDERADLIETLEQSDEEGRVLWLVDDLDRLAPADQAEVLGQLALSPAVIAATTPWQVEQTAQALLQANLGVATLTDMEPTEQEHLATVLLAADQPSLLSRPCLRWALAEIPHLARRPLGVAAVAAQVAAHDSHRVAIVRRALTEWLERAGLPELTWNRAWAAQSPLTRALFGLARATAMRQLESVEPVMVSLARARQIVEPDTWNEMEQTRLLERAPAADGLVFNLDVLAYLAAQAEPMRANWRLDSPDCQAPDFAESVNRYLGTLWELAGR